MSDWPTHMYQPPSPALARDAGIDPKECGECGLTPEQGCNGAQACGGNCDGRPCPACPAPRT